MANNSNEIRVNRALGKSGNLFFIPERCVKPFMFITFGVFLLYWLLSYVYPVSKMIILGIWLTLIVTYSLFYGENPWKLKGEFHAPSNWILGYLPFDRNQPQFKAKKKTKTKAGYGKNSRKVSAFENKLNLSSLVEICKGSNDIGAYLLEKNQKYRFVFIFKFSGIRSNLDLDSIEETIEVLKEGLKDLPLGESFVMRCGNFASNAVKTNELSRLQSFTKNKRLAYLLKSLKVRFNGLLKKGKFNDNPCYIECTYTLNNTAIEGEDLVEQILVGLQNFSEQILGKKEEHQKYVSLLNKAYQEGFIFWWEFLRSKLQLDYYIRPLNADEIYHRDYSKYNEGNIPEKPPQVLRLKNDELEFEINSPYHLSTNLFHKGSPDADKQWVFLPGIKKYVGGVIYNEKPGRWKGVKTQLEAGSLPLNNDSTVDTEIVIELTKPSQKFLQAKTQKKTKDSNSNLANAGNRGVIDVGANYNIKKSIELEEKFLDGGVALNVAWVGLVYRKSPQSLRIAINRFKSLFRQPAVVERETKYFDDIWLSTLPFRWEDMLSDSGRRMQYWTEPTVCLLPLNFESTKADRGLCLISDKGSVPLHLDVYTKPQHTAILGTTGSGKSVVLNGLTLMGLAYDLDVTIVDKTRGDGTGTFDRITDFVGGAYFNTMKESNNLFESVNPKAIADLEKRQAADKIFKRFLKTGLMSLVIDKGEDREKTRNYNSVFKSSLKSFFEDIEIINRYEAAHQSGIGYRNWQDIPTLKDYLKFLDREYLDPDAPAGVFEAAKEIKYQLKVICESSLGKIIATPSTFNTASKLVVYGIGEVEEEEMTPIALSAYSAAIRKSLTALKSLFFMDEASNLGSNFEAYGETLRSFTSRGRKEGVSVIYVGQDLDSINALPHSAQIIDNTENYLIGRIKTSALDLLQTELDIPREISRKNTLDSFSDKNNNSTPWLLKSGSTLSACHYYPSLQELCLIKNEPYFVKLRDEYFAKYENPYEAIAHLVKTIENN